MLEAKNISLTMGDKLLFSDLSFSVAAGETFCITGASGCGKTSLLKAIMGFVPIDSGFISIDGELITAESAIAFRRQMAYVPQEISFPCNTVRELVSMPFELHANCSVEFSEDNLFREFQKLDISKSLYDKKISEISGGQKQRILLATSRLIDKKIMILDEPTSSLDSDSSAVVSQYIADMANDGRMIISVSHNLEFADRCNKKIEL